MKISYSIEKYQRICFHNHLVQRNSSPAQVSLSLFLPYAYYCHQNLMKYARFGIPPSCIYIWISLCFLLSLDFAYNLDLIQKQSTILDDESCLTIVTLLMIYFYPKLILYKDCLINEMQTQFFNIKRCRLFLSCQKLM